MLYHEKQVAALCGVHCINTLLQGPYFNELDLAQIGQELDQLEQQILDEESRAAAGPSSNLDESGMFSIQVLAKALEVWHLTAVPTDNQELRQAGFDPQQQEAFICNLQEHWFAIRKVDGEWWNFNSLYPAPEQLSAFYLTAYLDSLKQQGYTIFVIRGQLPNHPAAGGALEGPGKWWSAEEAVAAHKQAQGGRQLGRARNAMEDAFARAAAGGGAISLRTASNKRPAAGQAGEDDDEDADLAAAIAASMQDHSAAAGGAGDISAAPSYAAVAGRAGHSEAAATAAGSAGLEAQDEFFEDDPELAAALAASLEEHQQQQQQQGHGQQHGQQQQSEQQQQEPVIEVPEAPAEDAEGAVTVAFRLPAGGRLSRRFVQSDTVAVLQAWLKQQLVAAGEMRPEQSVALSTQFPQKQLLPELELSAAGVEDRSMLSVQIS